MGDLYPVQLTQALHEPVHGPSTKKWSDVASPSKVQRDASQRSETA